MGISAEFYRLLETDPNQLDFAFLPQSPDHVDIEVTGMCAFKCPNCWGPRHSVGENRLLPRQWLEIIEELRWTNTSAVTITGGEPLLYDGINELVEGLAEQEVDTTLSTTGVDPDRLLPGLLPLLQQVGIPIDASTPEVNAQWRRSSRYSDGGLAEALVALRSATSEDYPDLDVTVRTVVTARNIGSLALVPDFLIDSGIDISRLRWKMYELVTELGPRAGRATHEKVSIDEVALADLMADTRFKEVVFQSSVNSAYRYMLIGPGGEARIIIPNESGIIEQPLGNIYSDFSRVLCALNVDHYDSLIRLSSGAFFDLTTLYPELRDGTLTIEELFTDTM
jgi:MoaA/NifB/PqqE/SkfB family radical SAM enzyme